MRQALPPACWRNTCSAPCCPSPLDLRGFERRQQARLWGGGRVEPIEGKTVLIIGLGKTGTAVASRAQAMGMHTLGIRARPKPMPCLDEVHGPDALLPLLGRADFIVCCVPLLPSTRGLLGTAAFAAIEAFRRAHRHLARRRRRRGGAARGP